MNTLFYKLCQSQTLLYAWKTVKQKGAGGGIDGYTIERYDNDIGDHLKSIQEELQAGIWKPEPYLRITIPKNEHERRKLGLLSIKDKIVQQAIRQLIEPRFEKVFVRNSYGYRPDKGHTKAIRFAWHLCQNAKYPVALRLDIDNYFDTINHDILFKRLQPLIADEEVLRLVELCVKMGVVNKKLQWNEITEGVPQGAVLSPLLANFYLHSFDQFVLTKTSAYVRYADDFIIFCKDREEAEIMLGKGTEFLAARLGLRLNEPAISEVKNGIEFLGILMSDTELSVSPTKKEAIRQKINELDWETKGFNAKGMKHLQGIRNYYAVLLPQNHLEEFDGMLVSRLREIISSKWKLIPNKTVLAIALKRIEYYAMKNILQKGSIRSELAALYLTVRSEARHAAGEVKNKQLIRQKKREYRKKENEATELLVNTFGTFIGVNNKGITLKVFGKNRKMPPTNNLSHITILSNGVSISSNAVDYCMHNRIPIDFFTATGQHTASILSDNFFSTSLWPLQASMSEESKSILARRIIYGKLKNQMNLIKYFHKYHKASSESLRKKYDEIAPKMTLLIDYTDNEVVEIEKYRETVMSWEANGAQLYWDYIRELISDDGVGFQKRERKGASDLVNSLLNYGYAILYPRVWQALLFRKLNPMDGVLHVRQAGKPTFVYDVVELFRSQAVDRVVVSLIQKGETLAIDEKGFLTKETKNLLVQNIMERINRYERYRGQETRFCDIIGLQTKEIADYIKEGKTFKPYIAKW